MSIHGTYRGVYSKLVDDPEFQELSSEARHTFLTMRVMPEIGTASIWRAYLDPIAQRTGYSVKRIETILDELSRTGWIRWDGVILWIVNGLKHDPTIKLTDEKHKKSVLRSLACLPKREIVNTFCDYYHLPRAFDGPSETHTRSGSPIPIPIPIPTPIPSNESDPPPEPTTASPVAPIPEVKSKANGNGFSSWPADWKPILDKIHSLPFLLQHKQHLSDLAWWQTMDELFQSCPESLDHLLTGAVGYIQSEGYKPASKRGLLKKLKNCMEFQARQAERRHVEEKRIERDRRF